MVARRHWMPLYIADYLADTAHLTAAQSGAYLLLIMHYWQSGSLPDIDGALARIARMTPAEWKRNRATIQSFFHDGWRHKRIDKEIVRAADISASRAAAAKRRHSKSSAIADQVDTKSSAFAEQVDTQSQSPSLDDDGDGDGTRAREPSSAAEALAAKLIEALELQPGTVLYARAGPTAERWLERYDPSIILHTVGLVMARARGIAPSSWNYFDKELEKATYERGNDQVLDGYLAVTGRAAAGPR
jgi:uncharacterized protein YdaU (DUF1376 family)